MKKLIWFVLVMFFLPCVAHSADLTPDGIRKELSATGRDFLKNPLTNTETIRILIAEDTLLDSQLAAITASPNGEVVRIKSYLTTEIASVVAGEKIKVEQRGIKAKIEAYPAEYIKQRTETLKGYKVMVETQLNKLKEADAKIAN